MSKEYRFVNLLGGVGKIRREMLDGREHIVVPVVALVEGAVRAMNAKGYEMVRAEKFGRAPGGWNGRPLFAGHPVQGRTPISGNDPRVLERSFGKIFNTKVDDRQRLCMEAWIDPERAERDPAAKRVLTRVLAHERGDANAAPIEVSVGAYVGLAAERGTWRDRAYDGAWDLIMPDHLALLAEDQVGACSVAMGCGALRAAMLTDDGLRALEGAAEIGEALEALRTLNGFDPDQPRDSDGQWVGPAYSPSTVSEKHIIPYRKGYFHAKTGYGFQKRDSGRRGSPAYQAYETGYSHGGEDSGSWRAGAFDPNQPRDEQGRWTDGSASGLPSHESVKSRYIKDYDYHEVLTKTPVGRKRSPELKSKMSDLRKKGWIVEEDHDGLTLFGGPEGVSKADVETAFAEAGRGRAHIDAAIADQERVRKYGPGMSSNPKFRMKGEQRRKLRDLSEDTGMISKLKQRALEFLRLAQSPGEMSDRDLRMKLAHELREMVPGFVDVEAMWPAMNPTRVVYSLREPKEAPAAAFAGPYGPVPNYEYCTEERSFTLSDSGEVEVGETAVRVQPAMYWEPVDPDEEDMRGLAAHLHALAGDPDADAGEAAQAAHDAAIALGAMCTEPRMAEVHECACRNKQSHQEEDMNRKERIAALAAHPHSTIKDLKALEALDDATLAALEASANATGAALKTAEDAAAALRAAQEELARPVSEERLPEDYRAMMTERRAADAAEAAGLVTTLKAAQTAYNEEELKRMTLPELRKLAAVARVPASPSYNGRPVPRVAAEAPSFAPPDPYAVGLKARATQSA